MLTQAMIHAFLREHGILPSDTVLIHTSMRALGEVSGGCDGVIDGFVSYLSEGLFLVPTHTWATVGEENPVYDVKKSVPCIGALPTVAAFRPDGIRSLHPTHSMTGFGKTAAVFLAGEETCQSPCPPQGAWARLYGIGAKILLIGVGLNRNTYIHAVDEMLDLPGRLVPPISLTVLDGEGKKYEISYCKHGKTGSENFGNYQAPLEVCGALKWGRLGGAAVGIFDVDRGTEVIKHLWTGADYDLCAEARPIPEDLYRDLI